MEAVGAAAPYLHRVWLAMSQPFGLTPVLSGAATSLPALGARGRNHRQPSIILTLSQDV